MKWFYSGAKELDKEQREPSKSLGGLRSSTVVPNGRINSMFNDFSSLSIKEGQDETKAFFIKNTFAQKVTGVLIYSTYPKRPDITFKVAATSGSEIEKLKSSIDEPYYEDFLDCRVVFSYTDMVILDNFVLNEVVKIEGTEVSVTDGKRKTFMNNAVKAFETSPQYKAVIIDESTLRLEYKLLGTYVNTPIIETFNSGVITANAFDFGFDNSRLIAQELYPDQSIGIFLKRSIVEKVEKTFDDYENMWDEFVASGYKQTQNLTKETINFCLEFTK